MATRLGLACNVVLHVEFCTFALIFSPRRDSLCVFRVGRRLRTSKLEVRTVVASKLLYNYVLVPKATKSRVAALLRTIVAALLRPSTIVVIVLQACTGVKIQNKMT